MTHRPRAIVYCQHIFGIGHLMRSLTVANELTKDFAVLLVIGGEPVDNLQPQCPTIYLPALRMYPSPPSVRPVDLDRDLDDVLLERQITLSKLIDSFMPDLVIVESYPFGRAVLNKELIPFLASCRRSKVITACSVRDILVRRSNQAEYDQVVVNLLNLYFDAVLVHSDPRVNMLSDSFSKVASVNIPIYHTGYVVRPGHQCTSSCPYCLRRIQTSHPHIVVSVGGGRSGRQLLLSTLDAAQRLEGTISHNFLIHTGPFAAPSEILDLQRRALKMSNVTISSFAPCLPLLFRTCALSISMGGYNTTMELLRNSTKALVWPYGERANEDQLLRCKALARLGAVRMLERQEVTEGLLANCILNLIEAPQEKCTFDFEGAERSRHIALELVAKRNVPASQAEA